MFFGGLIFAPMWSAALMLWWLPMQIATIYTQITLSWAPHHPMQEKGRYRDTRIWKSPVGTVLSSGMEYHFIHHLFPSIPLNKHPKALQGTNGNRYLSMAFVEARL